MSSSGGGCTEILAEEQEANIPESGRMGLVVLFHSTLAKLAWICYIKHSGKSYRAKASRGNSADTG